MEGSRHLAAEERDRLIRFFEALRALLDGLISRANPLLSDEALSLLTPAWTELQAEQRFEATRQLIEGGDLDPGLFDHGLHGHQLALKLGTAEHAMDAFAHEESKRFSRPGAVRRALYLALGAANVVLGSVAVVVPPVGAIKEFKEATEAALGHRVSFREKVGRVGRVFRRRRLPANEPVPLE